MNGRRRRDGDWKDWTDLKPGDYAKLPPTSTGALVAKASEQNDLWALCLPDGHYCHLSAKVHNITEHDDGTITVSPSILRKSTHDGDPGWHGYLECGVWRTA